MLHHRTWLLRRGPALKEDFKFVLRQILRRLSLLAVGLVLAEGLTKLASGSGFRDSDAIGLGLMIYCFIALVLVVALIRRLFFPNWPKQDTVSNDVTGIEIGYLIYQIPLVGWLLGGKERANRVIADSKRNVLTYLATAIVGPLAFPILFSQICRCVYLLWGGFSASGSTYWHWLKFGLDWEVESFLFNAPQIYGVSLSEIQAESWWARLIVVVFVVILQVLVVSTVFKMLELRELYSVLRRLEAESTKDSK